MSMDVNAAGSQGVSKNYDTQSQPKKADSKGTPSNVTSLRHAVKVNPPKMPSSDQIKGLAKDKLKNEAKATTSSDTSVGEGHKVKPSLVGRPLPKVPNPTVAPSSTPQGSGAKAPPAAAGSRPLPAIPYEAKANQLITELKTLNEQYDKLAKTITDPESPRLKNLERQITDKQYQLDSLAENEPIVEGAEVDRFEKILDRENEKTQAILAKLRGESKTVATRPLPSVGDARDRTNWRSMIENQTLPSHVSLEEFQYNMIHETMDAYIALLEHEPEGENRNLFVDLLTNLEDQLPELGKKRDQNQTLLPLSAKPPKPGMEKVTTREELAKYSPADIAAYKNNIANSLGKIEKRADACFEEYNQVKKDRPWDTDRLKSLQNKYEKANEEYSNALTRIELLEGKTQRVWLTDI